MVTASEHAFHSIGTSEAPRLQPLLHLVRVEALQKPLAHRPPAIPDGLAVRGQNRATYFYFYMAGDWIYFDVVSWELQFLDNLVPQRPRISHDLLHHGLFLRASGSGVIVD